MRRLPTEAEWVYACRAGTKTRFSCGNSDSDLGNYAWSSSNSGEKTHPVGGKRPNPWGLCDMHGNVWEWCVDWYDKYQFPINVVVSAPTGPGSGEYHVLCGGASNGTRIGKPLLPTKTPDVQLPPAPTPNRFAPNPLLDWIHAPSLIHHE